MIARRPFQLRFLIAIAAVCAVLLAAAPVRGPVRAQDPGAALALDADASNGSGPCSPVDSSATVTEGDEFTVGVCLTNDGSVPVAGFQYRVTYDDRLMVAPEVADSGGGVDDNPDANAGPTTFSSPDLGGGWDCNAGVGAYPEGDDDSVAENGVGVAWSGACGSAAGPNTLVEGPLGVIRFEALGGGVAQLSLTDVSVVNDNLIEIGSCAPTIETAMDCAGATITVSGAPVPDVTPGAVVTPGTPSVGSSPVGGGTPGAEETALAGGTPGTASTPGTSGTPGGDDGTPGTSEPDDDGTPGAASSRTPRAGTTGSDAGDDDDDSGSNATWLIVGVVAAAVVIVGGGAAWWFRLRNR